MQFAVRETPSKVAWYGDNQSLFRSEFALVRFAVSDFLLGRFRGFLVLGGGGGGGPGKA